MAMAAAIAMFVVVGANAAWCFPWSIDMYRGPAIQPLELAPRDMPPGTLPIHGLRKMSLEQMTVFLHNPLKPKSANLAHGKMLYDINCAPCHALNGDGNGTVAHLLKAHGFSPADLATGVVKNLPDGYIYGYIRNGGIHMPSYDDAMSSNGRWDVVMYVRQLETTAKTPKSKSASSK
jgi:mono/diheme cytochrome c family protein